MDQANRGDAPPSARWGAGLTAAGVDVERRTKVLAGLSQWWAEHPDDRPAIDVLVAEGRWDLIVDCFGEVLPFGTGGRRGTVGIGPNRFNPTTLCASVVGHVATMRKERPHGQLSVVVAFDVRRYDDLRGALPRPLNPLLGLRSADFGRMAAEVYAALGVRVWMPPEDSLSTPELCFAIRALGADGGLNVSASHNPPDDNGGKIYGPTGGQRVPPDDQRLAEAVAAVSGAPRLPIAEARAAGLVEDIPPHVFLDYARSNAALLPPGPRGPRIVLTNLHGTGDRTVLPALQQAGFSVRLVPEQAAHDGAFPTVPFAAPNPEVPESLGLAIALAEAEGAALVLGCDPDADRVGLAARVWPDRPGLAAWRNFHGQELAALITLAALRLRPPGAPSLVLTTEVTTGLVRAAAEAQGAACLDHLLVGFKYIGAAMDALAAGALPEAPGLDLRAFAVGVEESHGALINPTLRDKDAVSGALALAHLAAVEAEAGRSLLDTLDDLHREHGLFVNILMNMTMRGAAGRAQIQAVSAGLRAAPPEHLGGRRVLRFADRRDPTGPLGPHLSETDRVGRDVLVWWLEGGARLVLRPSGTEPKSKLYVELRADCTSGPLGPQREALSADAWALAEAALLDVLAVAGLRPPRWTLGCSDLLSIEDKLDLAAWWPGWFAAGRSAELQASRGALNALLRRYGPFGPALCRGGLLRWAEAEGPATAAAVRALLATPEDPDQDPNG